MIRKTLIPVAVAAALAATTSHACFLEMGLNGPLSTSDPLAIPVLVAARSAAAQDRIGWFGSTDEKAVRDVVLFLSFMPRIAADAPMLRAEGGIVFSVLQVQTGYWTRYRVTEDGALAAEGHRTGPEAGDDVMAVSDSALIAILRGRLDFETARDEGLIRGRGASVEVAMMTFEAIVAAFEVSSFGERIRSGPIPSAPERRPGGTPPLQPLSEARALPGQEPAGMASAAERR